MSEPRSNASGRFVRVVIRNGYELKDLSGQFQQFLKSIGAEYVSIETGSVCVTCRGSGSVVKAGHRGCIVMPSDKETCSDCDGRGR